MTDSNKPTIDQLQGEVAFWISYREICRSKKIDTIKLYMVQAEEEKQKLASPGAGEDFVESCEVVCFRLVLAGVFASSAVRYSRGDSHRRNCDVLVT